jgi:hypothetical protein
VLDDNGRSNWSDFMQSVCQGQHPAVATVNFFPILNLNPMDYNCIFYLLKSEMSSSGNVSEYLWLTGYA